MATYRYYGKLTNFQLYAFAASREIELSVRPENPAYGVSGLLVDSRIPVTIQPNGDFEVWLEASQVVKPKTLYLLEARWLDSESKNWTQWARFDAKVGGGNIGDLATAPTPAWAIAYGDGTPQDNNISRGLYIDISGSEAVLYGPADGRV